MRKFALVTGASGDIGFATALELVHCGYTVYAHYNENELAIDQLIASCPTGTIHKLHANLEEPAGFLKIIAGIDQLDAIVLASGTSVYGLVSEIPRHEVERFVYHQINAFYQLVQLLLPKLIAKKSGNIVAITSVWGEVGASCEVLYSMVKGGQNAFVKALSKEVAPSGIRVNAVAPGAISTKMLAGFTPEELEQLVDEIPLKRLGMPAEVAKAVSFLLSDQASYISGQIFKLNGGWFRNS